MLQDITARRTIRRRPLGLNDVQSGREGCTHTAAIDLLVAQQRGAAPRRPSAAAIERPEGPGFPRECGYTPTSAAGPIRGPAFMPREVLGRNQEPQLAEAALGACTPQLTVGPMQKYQATPAAPPDPRTRRTFIRPDLAEQSSPFGAKQSCRSRGPNRREGPSRLPASTTPPGRLLTPGPEVWAWWLLRPHDRPPGPSTARLLLPCLLSSP